MEKENLKVGKIVVVVEGTAFGNTFGTITQITKVKVDQRFNNPVVACGSKKKSWNSQCDTKIPSFFEYIQDLRLPTPDEKKAYSNGIFNIHSPEFQEFLERKNKVQIDG